MHAWMYVWYGYGKVWYCMASHGMVGMVWHVWNGMVCGML